jgi:methionyl-tRNA synthetase
VAITLKAEQAGKSYEEYVDHWNEVILRTLSDVGIEFDIYSGTAHHRNPHHRELSQRFFLDLQKNGYVFEQTEEQYYSEALGRFLPDRYIEGVCYKCDYEKARGDECPSCGSWLDAKKLKDPRSTLDGNKPLLKPSKHWYLDLGKIKQEWLSKWFESKKDDWKVNVRHFVKGALKDLRERPITRDLPWGVPVPLPDTEGKVLYVWFDAPIGYLSISKQYWHDQGKPERFEKLWQSPDTKLYHFIGKDNITFHVVVFPAMLHGTKAGWIVPENVPANEFFNLEGKKFNTSAGWYIPEDSIKGKYSIDQLRYALATMMPETADSDWSWQEFQSRLNDDLADNLGNFVARTLRFAERFLAAEIPALAAAQLTAADEAILAAGKTAAEETAALLHGFQFRKACQRLMAYGSACNKYYDEQQPWVTRKSNLDRCGQTLRVCAELIRTIAVLSYPVLPHTAKTLLGTLGLEPTPALADAGGIGLADGPLKVAPLPVLFPKVEDKVIQQELSPAPSSNPRSTRRRTACWCSRSTSASRPAPSVPEPPSTTNPKTSRASG